ncbi:ABC transporter ATP-binding protein [Paenibacillus sp. 1011MAR3C5]|uniref:ABC transporter ATP-binding protein n=1 Tax=Paenibacillus sp. 1011MAR3C5 TaxID=1675787 RepID=UPI000E6B678A|nr:ABC transporter ATP-binding protein [Paenibacillus sp. 1011MAR3C5]RJE89021.1 ABC transporter ATP-binding protein [Paenibacillus sp. 1011MAR3C5]
MLEPLKEPFRYAPPKALREETAAGVTGKKPAKAKDASGTLQRLWRYLAFHRMRLAAVFVMIVFSTILSLLGPYLAGTAIDRFIEMQNTGFIPFLIGMAVVYGLHAWSMWLQNIWMIGIAQETVRGMRRDLFAHLHKLPIPFFARRQHGELMSRVTNDIENVSSSLNSSFIQLVSSILLLVGIVGVMLSLSPLLTLLTFMVIPLMVFGMKWITSRTSRLFKEQQRNIGDLNGFVEETLSGQRIIKAFSREAVVIEDFNERNKRIHLSGFWAQAISGFIPKLMNGLNNLSFASIVGVGALLVIGGHGVTVGTILIFAEFSRQFTRPLNDLANQWNTLLSAMAGAERVFQIMDESVEAADEQEAAELDMMKGQVEFRNVSFAYQEGHPILRQVSFDAEPGETVAFVGPTGAGKSTIIGLLCRFYEPSAGSIRIDGHPASGIRRDSLRSHMAFVLQDPFLFEGTIRDNIRYGKLEATDEEVEEAAKLANAHSFIMRLRGGYGAKLKPDGGGISQGQKQLIAIARAILADPAILVLDEATSSIDTVTEIKIQEALHRLMKGRTSFVIAHRLNTIQSADRIIVLQDGEVTESGTHDDLLLRDGFYSKLVNGQVVLT